MESKEKLFDNNTLKTKLTLILLYCLSYGASVKPDEAFEKRIQKKMKLEYDFDPTRIRSCLDLIQDTESAIEEFAQYGLQKFKLKKIDGDGEMYLRLYGILNAIYLQMQSIIELFEVLKSPNKKDAVRELKQLKIFEIRNVAGAHTVNYIDNENISPKRFSKNFFRLTHVSIDAKSERMYAVDGFHNIRNFNLYESFIEYNQISEKLLYDCVLNYFNKIIKSEKEKVNILGHYEIDGFTPTDYKKMYRNDELIKKMHKKIQKRLKKEFENIEDFNLEEETSNMSEEEINKMHFFSFEDMKNKYNSAEDVD